MSRFGLGMLSLVLYHVLYLLYCEVSLPCMCVEVLWWLWAVVVRL